MAAAVLFLAPGILVGSVRLLGEDDVPSLPGLAVGLVVAVLFVAVFTHVGARLALRRGSPAGH